MDPRDHQDDSKTIFDQDSLDFDLGPAGPYADQRPDYYPRKKGGPTKIWLGIALVLVILGLTWFAFKTEPVVEMPATPTAAPASPDALTPRAPEGPPPEKQPGTVDFSPVQEARPAASAAAASSGTAQPAAKPAAKPAEAKPAPAAKPAEPKPAAKPAAKPDAPQPEAAQQPAAASVAEAAQPAVPKAAEGQPTAGTEAEAPAVAISDQWVVNVSSTPDEEESKRLWARIDKQVVGRKLYSYQTAINGRVHYRIRMGFFATRAEAEEAGQKIKENLGLAATPWAVQPTVDEVDKYK